MLPLVLLALAFTLAPPSFSKEYVVSFGSCSKQYKDQSYWNDIAGDQPDVFVFLGDNVYADTDKENEMRSAYEQLGSNTFYKRFEEKTKMLATWDDHDYGVNDGGIEFKFKKKAQDIFLDFFKVDANDPRRQRKGIYHSEMIDYDKLKIQIILLDTRYHRSKLLENKYGQNIANYDERASVLGDAQWLWLKEQLRKPSDIKIIASSIQFLSEQHPYEKWANFPLERAKMLDLIKKEAMGSVLFLSGDRHHGEISRSEVRGLNYPIYDITSSGLTNAFNSSPRHEDNIYRIANTSTVTSMHYALMKLKKETDKIRVAVEIKGKDVFTSHEFHLPLQTNGNT